MAKTQGKKATKPGKKESKTAKPAAKSKQTPKKSEEGDQNELTDEMIQNIETDMASLKEELNKAQKNASAARRARKLTTILEKKFKAFRKASNEHHRKE